MPEKSLVLSSKTYFSGTMNPEELEALQTNGYAMCKAALLLIFSLCFKYNNG